MAAWSATGRAELQLEQQVARAFSAIAANPIRYALAALASGLLIGGTIFSFAEEKTSMPDGIWWAFVSMTTVGYGDIAPHTTGIRFLATFVIATGIAATAILTAALAGRIAEARLRAARITLDLDDDFDDLAARLQALKERYRHEETHDDVLLRHAAVAVEVWTSRAAHGSDDRVANAMENLTACLTTHPEYEEPRHGATQ